MKWTKEELNFIKERGAIASWEELLAGLRGKSKWAIAHQIRNQGIKRSGEVQNRRMAFNEVVETFISKIKSSKLEGLPKIKIERIKQGKGDEEEIVLVISDWQIGHKTRSFNAEVAKERVVYLLKSFLKTLALHRLAYPIRKIHIFALGDFTQSELIGFKVDLSELEMVWGDQVLVADTLLEYLITEISKHFDEVYVYCVRGNHGKGMKGTSDKTNFDDILYHLTAKAFKNNPRVHFNIAREFYQIVNIYNWKFLLVHGDQVRGGSYNIPLYALLQKMLRWATSFMEKWNFMICGHWHNYGHLQQNNQELIVNGTLVSDDEFVRREYGWECSTLQVMFSVHPRKGITWVHRLKLLN